MDQNASSDIYIFGYQSILAAGSLDTSVGMGEPNQLALPARLEGYVRCWAAVRNFVTNETKRYVHTDDWRIADRVAFATLIPCPGKAANGLCWRISSDRLEILDFREQGYTRIDVGKCISPYDGYEIDRSIPCYTYIDPTPDLVPAVVSRSYYDMGRSGAASINNLVPQFSADYLSSTVAPTILADDLAFVFFSGDGHRLWLLEESDSSLVMLHRFARPQVTPLTSNPPESQRLITPGLEWLDARHRGVRDVSDHRRIPSGMVIDLLRAADGEDISTSPYWLCRLVATDSALTSPSRLKALATDSDFWVRRAAQF